MNIALVGPGWISDVHAQALEASTLDVSITQVVGGHSRAAIDRVRSWGARHLAHIDDLDRATVDAAWVCSPTADHVTDLEWLIRHGIPAVVEKPPTVHRQDTIRLWKLASDLKVPVLPVHHERYRPVMEKARALLRDRVLGDVVAAHLWGAGKPPSELMEGWRQQLPPPGGGTMADSGYHSLYLARFLWGRPTAVIGTASRQHWALQAEDTAMAHLSYPQMAGVSVFQSWAAEPGRALPRLVIWGTSGTLSVVGTDLWVNQEHVATDDGVNPFTVLAERFNQIRMQRDADVDDLLAAIETMAIRDAYYLSCETGQRIVPPSMDGDQEEHR